jgi:hypothetical protein
MHTGVNEQTAPAKSFQKILKTANFPRVLFIYGGKSRDFSRELLPDDRFDNMAPPRQYLAGKEDGDLVVSGQTAGTKIRLGDFTGKNLAGEWGVAGISALKKVFEFVHEFRERKGYHNVSGDWGA